MGISTNAQLHYGLLLEEGASLPWDGEDDDGSDLEEWWRRITGFPHEHLSPFDQDGQWKNGVEDERGYRKYAKLRDAWDKQHPLPFELVNVCHCNNPIYLLAIGEGHTAHRGYPVSISLEELAQATPSEEDRQSLLGFCTKYGIENDGKLSWWLSSYSDF